MLQHWWISALESKTKQKLRRLGDSWALFKSRFKSVFVGFVRPSIWSRKPCVQDAAANTQWCLKLCKSNELNALSVASECSSPRVAHVRSFQIVRFGAVLLAFLQFCKYGTRRITFKTTKRYDIDAAMQQRRWVSARESKTKQKLRRLGDSWTLFKSRFKSVFVGFARPSIWSRKPCVQDAAANTHGAKTASKQWFLKL